MSNNIDLTQGKWRLHTRIGVVGYWDMATMGKPESHGTGNSDVVFTFDAKDAELAPVAPDGLQGTWYKAIFPPEGEGDDFDTEPARGVHWVRVFPGIEGGYPLIQIVQMNYPYKDKKDTLRIFIGRWVGENPTKFFGHGTGNDGVQNHSFTFTQE